MENVTNVSYTNDQVVLLSMTKVAEVSITASQSTKSVYDAGARRSSVERSSDRSLMVTPLSYFSLQPMLHHWCNKGRGMCYPVCGIVHIKEPLLLIGKCNPYCGSGFPLSLSEWSFIICPTPTLNKMC